MSRALVLLAEGFEINEAVTPVNILRRAGVEVKTASIDDNLEVLSTQGVPVIADDLLKNVNTADLECLILPGGQPGTDNLIASEPVKRLVVEHNKAEKLLAAICAAPSALATFGVIGNRSVTCFPGFEDAFTSGTLKKDPLVVEDKLITAKAMGYAIDFSLEILSKLEGRECADKIKKSIFP